MDIEKYIREIVRDELQKLRKEDYIPLEEFCKEKKVSRSSVWQAEKRGEVKIKRLGRKVFVHSNFGK